MVVPEERGMREISIKVECILVEVVVEMGVDKVVVEKKMRLSRETFEDFFVFSTDLALGTGGVKTWTN